MERGAIADLGTELGPWTPSNQCQSFAKDVLRACQNMSSPVAFPPDPDIETDFTPDM